MLQYGDPSNSTRPGGPITLLTFASEAPPNGKSVFHIIADNSTSASLLASIYNSCSSLFGPDPPSTAANSAPSAYNKSDASCPQPEQAVQYYRASSVVLTLDGYNNSAVLSAAVTGGHAGEGGVADSPLPANVDLNLLECLNGTIGTAVPLIDFAAPARWQSAGGLGALGMVWVLLCLLDALL